MKKITKDSIVSSICGINSNITLEKILNNVYEDDPIKLKLILNDLTFPIRDEFGDIYFELFVKDNKLIFELMVCMKVILRSGWVG